LVNSQQHERSRPEPEGTDAALSLRPRRRLSARLEIRSTLSTGYPAGLEPIPGSRLLFRAGARLPTAGVRVSRELRVAELGAPDWTRGWDALLRGAAPSAQACFERCKTADARFIAGCLALTRGDGSAARSHFEATRRSARGLGLDLHRSELDTAVWIAAPGSTVARIRPERSGVILAVLLLAAMSAPTPAVPDEVVRAARGDVGLRLLACNLLLEGGSPRPASARRLLRLTEAERAGGPSSALLLLFRARALRRLGRPAVARAICARAAAAAPRGGTLGSTLLLEHAGAYRDLGLHAHADRKLRELERIAPGFARRASRRGVQLEVAW